MAIKKNRKSRDIFSPEEDDSEGGGVGSYTPFTDEKISDIVPFIETRDETLITLIEAKDEELTALMMEDEGKFGAVSKTRRKRKNRDARGSGRRPDFPQHPLLDTQRFAGLSESDSPLASENVDAQDALLENLAGLVEQYPELRLNPALSNSLQARIDLYNKQQHVNAPELKRH